VLRGARRWMQTPKTEGELPDISSLFLPHTPRHDATEPRMTNTGAVLDPAWSTVYSAIKTFSRVFILV